MAVYNPGMLVQAHRRPWRVDSQQDSLLFLTAGDETRLQTHINAPLLSLQRSSALPVEYSHHYCTACGKWVMGYNQADQTRRVHGEKEPGHLKIG